MTNNAIRRLTAVTAAAGLAVLVPAGAAAAHVRSDGAPVAQGGYGVVGLIVPGESELADTVGLTVTIPAGVDLKSARTLPVPGWTANVERQDGRVARIVWTASTPESGFSNAEYQKFSFSAGPWPEGKETVALPSEQKYSDGSVVAWNEVAVDRESEPEHPAPVVALSAADGHDAHGGSTEHEHDHDEQVAASADGSGWQSAVSVLSLVLSLAAAGGVALLLRRDRGA
ncbi:YcnI family protein [Nocardia sp. NPDC057227]|uniref:YcnI family copper-binding membrane protein n=1 Tax=Nocardia sp. NPDC057227 TaxID=3346056 RepID=UPI003625DF0D